MVTAKDMYTDVRLVEAVGDVAAGSVGVLIDILGDDALVEFPFFIGEAPYIGVRRAQLEPVGDQGSRAA